MRTGFTVLGASLATFWLACGSSDNSTGTTSGPGGSMTDATGTTASSVAATSSSTGAGGAGGAQCGGTTPAHVATDVKRYEYTFDLTTSKGHSKVIYDSGMPAIVNGAHADFGLKAFDGALWNDKPAASANIMKGALDVLGEEVCTPTVSLAGDVTVPKKNFLNLDVGFAQKLDLAGGKFDYLLSWVGGCSHFGPCNADPGTLAEFAFDIKHAAGDVVLCPGTRTAAATETKCEVKGTLAPTYSAFAFANDSKWVEKPFVTDGALNVLFYEVPNGQVQAAADAASFKEYLDWIQALLGPFPYGNELRFAGGPTVWLGFEHPANIVLNEVLPTQTGAYSNPTMHVMMHETAHQWSGDRATIKTPLDFVWKEATVEYLSYVFEDEHRPVGEAAASLAYWDDVSLFSSHYPRPTDSPAPSVDTFYGDVYGPGPMVLYVQLETMLGRQAVLGGIKKFLEKPGAYSVDDLRAALEASSGQKLKPYFDAWVFGKGVPEWPTFKVATMQSGNTVTVTLTQMNQSGKLYGCKIGVNVKGATTSALGFVDFGLDPQSAVAQTTVQLTEAVQSTELDPDHRVVGHDAAMPYKVGPKRKVFIL